MTPCRCAPDFVLTSFSSILFEFQPMTKILRLYASFAAKTRNYLFVVSFVFHRSSGSRSKKLGSFYYSLSMTNGENYYMVSVEEKQAYFRSSFQ